MSLKSSEKLVGIVDNFYRPFVFFCLLLSIFVIMQPVRQYIAIDLKSFYASVECVERSLDPLDTCLVVADKSRTSKTICLAVSPALKAYGTGGRPRLFEVEQRVAEVNRRRGHRAKSVSARELQADNTLAVDYVVAPPRMALYVAYSTRVYDVYLRFIAPEDIHVYSIDEVFIDATAYLGIYNMTAHQLAMTMIRTVLAETGITATAGIGTNLYLSKIAMDIMAKKMRPDSDGVRIAELDEMSYRRQLWGHTPLTDFWRIGRGTARNLERYGLFTMGDIARCSIGHEDELHALFGVNAELLIDHAWGIEPVTIAHIKAYRPEEHSLCSGQVLQCAYTVAKARNVALEMADAMALELLDKRLLTDQIVLHIGYDVDSLTDPDIEYDGPVKADHYGRRVPVPAHGSLNIKCGYTSSSRMLRMAMAELFDRIVNDRLLVRRITLTANHVVTETDMQNKPRRPEQLELFVDYDELARRREAEAAELARERRREEAILRIKRRFGKNAILKGLNFAEGATQRDRNNQIGGHKA